ncbi:MAG: hypothetical protein M3Z13_02335 [Candidatus Dormibacteraeota bacterium]|nr:hypothetical protein [Candidatus Dormibacteraeota bacterium]
MIVALRVVAVLVGIYLVVITVSSSLKTVILPRAVPSKISRFVFLWTRTFFEIYVGKNASYSRRDRIMSAYGPTGLLLLLGAWIVIILFGYSLIFWGVNGGTAAYALNLSGSSILTLGFERPFNVGNTLLVLSEGGIGLVEIALLITYLPTMYSAFQRRETAVSLLEVRAGSPPSGVLMLERFFRLDHLEHLDDEVWTRWEEWFVDVEETHTSIPTLPFFRSPHPDRHWVTAAGAVLDGAALMRSSLDMESDVHADLCIRAGYICLRRIAGFFQLPYNSAPVRGDPISVTREEFESALDHMQANGLPVRADRDAAWGDFAGWRVNYDDVLIALAALTSAPHAPWSSDRAPHGYGRRLSQALKETHS